VPVAISTGLSAFHRWPSVGLLAEADIIAGTESLNWRRRKFPRYVSRIRILPEAVANRIAAGEVVERPASVVKELLENSLDAGAGSIRIEIEAGGKRMIRVVDDGCGMLHDDALLSFERHATSKLRTSDDLVSIATLGFRGEALPSMASVSRLLLETRSAEEENGTSVEFAGGRLVGVKPAGLPVGTSVSVADLFYCVPARRQFLKSESTELGHIASLVTHYALAYPQKQFALKTPSQEIVNTPPVETLAERFYQLFGKQALDEMIEMSPQAAPMRAAITEADLDEAGRAAELSVRGFISRPQVQRANRNGIYVFVNRRLVRDRLLLHAVHDAYRNVLPAGVFPVVLLFLDLPAAEVDVNVHPSKIEVRFRHPQFVHDFARDAIRLTLGKARPVPSFSAPATPQSVAAAAAGGAGEFGETGSMSAPRAVLPPFSDNLDSSADSFGLSAPPLPPEAQRFHFEPGAASEFGAAGIAESFVSDRFATQPLVPGIAAAPAAQAVEFPASAASLADLKPLGQVNSSFIVAVNGEGLWLIDQHVAHERVLFEQHVRARQQGGLTGQRLLTPIIVQLAPRQRVILDQIAEELAANGFDVTPMGQDSVAIHSTPAGVAAADAEQLLAEILSGIERERQAVSIDSLQAKIAASTACHAAIKVNMPLDLPKMEWLLAQLAGTDLPMSCPHGRPVLLRYSLREIERAFKRI
jgi:DNA mismatch repair protein MutL